MTKGRPPIPAHLKLLRGNPGQYRVMPEPEPEIEATVPEPPSFITGYAAEEWRHVAVELYRLGMLTKVDVAALAAYCQAYQHWRSAEEMVAQAMVIAAEPEPAPEPEPAYPYRKELRGIRPMRRQPRPPRKPKVDVGALVRVANEASLRMLKFASEFGLTPSSRARFSLDPKRTQKSKFEKLLAG